METKNEVAVSDAAAQVEITDDMIDPASAIVTVLSVSGHPNPMAWLHGIDPDALNESVDKQRRRFLVNRQWRLIIGQLDVKQLEESTAGARYCLIDDGPLTQWLTVFEDNVLPLIMKHSLPLAE